MDMMVGYGAVHVPTRPGRYDLKIPLFVPASASLMQTIIGFFTGVSPSYIERTFIAKGDDREVTKTQSQGHLSLTVNVVVRGFKGLDLHL
jgi:B9 domain-containing protein 1